MPAHLMDSAAQDRPVSPLSRFSPLAGTAMVLGASLVLGGGTSFAQTFLPAELNSFANSASGWTLLTALLVWLVRGRPALSAVLGAIGFVGLVLGYTLVADLRGYFYSPVLFVLVGLIVGPFVGIAASWLHRDDWQTVAGSALLAGIAVGEGFYGLTAVAEITSPFYWVVIAALGLTLLAWTFIRRAKTARIRAGALAMTAVTALAFNVAYLSLGSISQ